MFRIRKDKRHRILHERFVALDSIRSGVLLTLSHDCNMHCSLGAFRLGTVS